MIAAPEDLRHALKLAALDAQDAADPLSLFSFTNPENGRKHGVQERFVQSAARGIETTYRASGQNGKTHIGGVFTLAMVQGRDEIDGVRLPRLEQPCVWWVLSQSWPGQVEAAQKKLLELLGNWPHHVAWVNAGLGYAGAIWVKYIGCRSDDWRDWSKISFFVEGAGTEHKGLPGGRIDGAWGDEPPNWKRWDEIRARGKKNRPLYRVITYTPLERERWEPLRAEFVDCQGYVNQNRIEFVARLQDNPFLSDEYVASLVELWSRSEYADARIRGEFVDLKGTSPFQQQYGILKEMADACRPPRWQASTVRVRLETPRGRVLDQRVVRWEWWYPPEEEESCYAVLDTSLGIKDEEGRHDPGCAHVYGRRWVRIGGEWYLRRRLVARFNGYESSYNLGAIAAAMGRQYRNAAMDVETNGGYGDGALDALADCGYVNYALEASREKMGSVADRLGFRTTEVTKPMYISQIQKMAEERSVDIPSAALLSCLLAAKLDGYGRLYKPLGVKYEDFVCLGRFLSWDSMNPLALPREKPPVRFEEVVNQSFGRNVLGGRAAASERSPAKWRRSA